jgi:NhaP-type Na+/H+ or K+/H+ antiporter
VGTILNDVVAWYVFIGAILITVAVAVPTLYRRWFSPTHILFIAGVIAGPMIFNLAEIRVQDHAQILQLASEIAVLISLYAAGIKLRIPFRISCWQAPILLATVTMLVTIGISTALGMYLFGLPLGAAILLGAVLAPTDPVLADKVQVENPDDPDTLRQSLTGEAGLNDGTAFPFVLLAVGLCDPKLHPLGDAFWKWFAIDVLWSVTGGLALGIAAGTLLGRWSWYRSPHQKHKGVDELLAIGFVAVIYGAALMLHTYGFLAVFAAAVCLRHSESLAPEHQSNAAGGASEDTDAVTRDQSHGTKPNIENQATLLREQTEVASALERIAQAFLVVVIGIILTSESYDNWRTWLFAALLICVIRPLAVLSTLHVSSINSYQRNLIAWFGIRGIGTVYYLSHVLAMGIAKPLGNHVSPIIDSCIVTITLSIWLHGLSDTPLMRWYTNKRIGTKSQRSE